MKKKFVVAVLGVTFSLALAFSYAQDLTERKMILRQAQERVHTTAAVEAYLTGDVLEVTVYARMYAAKPKIFNVILVGPKLGRLSPRSKETLYPKAEEEDQEMSFPTTDKEGGFIRLSKRTKDKIAKGALTRELSKFKIPTEKIQSKGTYQLRILIESMQSPGKQESFIFPLEGFAQLFGK